MTCPKSHSESVAEPEYAASVICLGDADRGSRLPVLPSAPKWKGPPSQGRQQPPTCPWPRPCSPGPPASGWPLTVPQVGVSEVEGPDESREGILRRAGLDPALHRSQLHALHPCALGPGRPLLSLQRAGPGLSRGSGLPVLGTRDCSPPTHHATTVWYFLRAWPFTLGEGEAQTCGVM